MQANCSHTCGGCCSSGYQWKPSKHTHVRREPSIDALLMSKKLDDQEIPSFSRVGLDLRWLKRLSESLLKRPFLGRS